MAGIAGADYDGAFVLAVDGCRAGEFGGVAELAVEVGEPGDGAGDVGLAACAGCLYEVLRMLSSLPGR